MGSKSTQNIDTEESASPASDGERAPTMLHLDDENLLPALARLAVETYILENRIVEVSPALTSPLLADGAACFVSIKTVERKLRGCIGTVKPTRKTLAEEIVINAISAATRDPRFPPVLEGELQFLRYTVDVLERPEPARLEDLNPTEFGVIVEDNTGLRRGLLLPAIEGIETASEQVTVAARKAGISSGEPHQLYRFRVRRFRETRDA